MRRKQDPRHADAEINAITGSIVDAAIEVHRVVGPGALESSYNLCLEAELLIRGLHVRSQVPLALFYKSIRIEGGYRLDLVVDRRVVVELKAVERVLPVHHAQLLSYLRLGGYSVGLLLNFSVARMIDGVVRVVNNYQPPTGDPV